MKKKWNIIIATLALVALPALAWVGIAGAQRFSATVEEGEVVDSSLYSAGQNVDINGTINGDVFCAGQTVRIDATVRGDVICAGQNVSIKGKIDGNIRVAGQTVTIDAQVDRSMTVAGQTVSFDADAVVNRDATVTASSVNLKGKIGRDAVLGGSEIMLRGEVGRDVEASAPKVDMFSGARIGGNLTYTSEKDASIPPGVNIIGEVTHNPVEEQRQASSSWWGVSVGAYLYFLAALLAIGLALVLFFPQAVRKTSDLAQKHLGKTILIGFVAGLAVPVVVFSLAITFVGLPLAIILMLSWMVLMVLSLPVAGYYLAGVLFKKLKHSVAAMLVGTAILVTLFFIPFVGFVFALAAYWIGSGALLLAIKRHMPKPVYKA